MIARPNSYRYVDTAFIRNLDERSKLVKTGKEDLVFVWSDAVTGEIDMLGMGMSNLNLSVIKYASNISDGTSILRNTPEQGVMFAISINDLHAVVKEATEESDRFTLINFENDYGAFSTGLSVVSSSNALKASIPITLNDTNFGRVAAMILANTNKVAVAYSEDVSNREDFMNAVNAKAEQGLRFIPIGHNIVPVWSGLVNINKGDSCSIGIKYVDTEYGRDTYASYTVAKPKKNAKVTTIVKILQR